MIGQTYGSRSVSSMTPCAISLRESSRVNSRQECPAEIAKNCTLPAAHHPFHNLFRDRIHTNRATRDPVELTVPPDHGPFDSFEYWRSQTATFPPDRTRSIPAGSADQPRRSSEIRHRRCTTRVRSAEILQFIRAADTPRQSERRKWSSERTGGRMSTSATRQ